MSTKQRKPVRLTSPMPTVEQFAEWGGVSKKRLKELKELAVSLRLEKAVADAMRSKRKK